MAKTTTMTAPSPAGDVVTEKPRPTREPRPPRTAGAMSWWSGLLLRVALVSAAIGLWQLAHIAEVGRPVVVQSPGSVWTALVDYATGDVLWTNFWATIQPTLITLCLAAVVGIPIGLMLGLLPRTERVISPFISALNSMPRIALAPIFIIIFGIDTAAKVALAFSIVVFITLLNARAGVNAADPEALRMMTTLGASKTQTIRKVILPAAVPSILAGLRLALIYSLLGVITSELIASRDGLGQLIATNAGVFNLANVYAILVVLILTATMLNLLFETVERRLTRWQPPTTR